MISYDFSLPGRACEIGPEDEPIDGVVCETSLTGTVVGLAVEYRVVWWQDGTRNEEWLSSCEVRFEDDDVDPHPSGMN